MLVDSLTKSYILTLRMAGILYVFIQIAGLAQIYHMHNQATISLETDKKA